MTSRDAEFDAFDRHYRQRLRRAAFLLCGDWAQAEDIVQEALTKLYVAWWRISAEQGAFGYASKIVTNAAVDASRRPWRREVAVGDNLTYLAGRSPEVDPTERLTLRSAQGASAPATAGDCSPVLPSALSGRNSTPAWCVHGGGEEPLLAGLDPAQ